MKCSVSEMVQYLSIQQNNKYAKSVFTPPNVLGSGKYFVWLIQAKTDNGFSVFQNFFSHLKIIKNYTCYNIYILLQTLKTVT